MNLFQIYGILLFSFEARGHIFRINAKTQLLLRPVFGYDLYATKCSPGFTRHEDSDRMFPPSGRKGQVEVRVTGLDMKVGLLGGAGSLLVED